MAASCGHRTVFCRPDSDEYRESPFEIAAKSGQNKAEARVPASLGKQLGTSSISLGDRYSWQCPCFDCTVNHEPSPGNELSLCTSGWETIIWLEIGESIICYCQEKRLGPKKLVGNFEVSPMSKLLIEEDILYMHAKISWSECVCSIVQGFILQFKCCPYHFIQKMPSD